MTWGWVRDDRIIIFLGELYPTKKSNIFKIHLFHTKYSLNLLTYLLIYRSRLTDIKNINKLYLEYFVKPKMWFNATIDEDCMIFE